jgi:formylglycine-generating enzyme required for sulfatase activity
MAAEALVAIGPEALFQVSPHIPRHLDDPFEHAWRAAVSVEEEIARRYQDGPRLDDYYRGLAPLRFPSRTFALPGGVAIEFVKVPAGTFVQGSLNPGTGVLLAADMPCDYAPVRKVTISRAFWMARDEVSQEQWEAVMGFNRSREKRPHLPIELISWGEAVEFCRRLSAMFPPHEFDLPTEAQWEYACRGGSTGRHAFGNRRLLRGDWRLQEGGEWHENRFGLRRMHDGVFEWCRDWFAAYPPDACTDPVGPPAGEYRAIRSNYRCCSAADCRSAHRAGFPPDPRHGVGFRPVCSG